MLNALQCTIIDLLEMTLPVNTGRQEISSRRMFLCWPNGADKSPYFTKEAVWDWELSSRPEEPFQLNAMMLNHFMSQGGGKTQFRGWG